LSASTHSPVLKHHFDNLEQQHSAERLGMWMFLVTEVLFFSGLFVAYTAYRNLYPHEFHLASSHLILWIAAVNTGLLITSSLTMTFAIRSAQLGDRPALIRNLLLTFLLGAGFLGLKAYEYATDYHERLVPGRLFAESDLAKDVVKHAEEENAKTGKQPGEDGYVSPEPTLQRLQIFLCFYYIMTGIHGIHILVGLGCILWLVQQAYCLKIPRENYSTVEVVSLYWHLVDMIWLFLMPILYLAGAGLKHH
jgi:cytochrome c oxidase subunit 3